MKFPTLTVLVASLATLTSGCAHLDRQAELHANAFDVMTDAEIAQAAIAEALGELHKVDAIDPDGFVTAGQAAFTSREERLSYERRVDALVRARIYGQGHTLELLRVRCEQLQRAGWESWPQDAGRRRTACEYGDASVTLHSLFKKPLLQRAFVDLLLEVAADPLLAGQVKRKLVHLETTGVEPYLFAVERWDRVEGFRPRG
ncbi:MAG: hypothetical protein U0228_01420 [Myxococcaceae bacterium]